MLGMVRGLVGGLLGVCLAMAATSAAQAEKRLALIIGNDGYQNVDKLQKAKAGK